VGVLAGGARALRARIGQGLGGWLASGRYGTSGAARGLPSQRAPSKASGSSWCRWRVRAAPTLGLLLGAGDGGDSPTVYPCPH